MGKGQILVFDAFIEKTLESMRAEFGYYPSLKGIGERCTPPQSNSVVTRSLARLAAAGRLSQEARLVYNAKNNLQIEKENNTNEKTIKNSKIKSRSKAAKK
jgi:hypothetical protein